MSNDNKVRPSESLPISYFEQLYTQDADPWRFATSPYEAAKYQATLAALPRPRYGTALEIGCSIGVLTRQLAARCGQLLSLDVSKQALAQAQQRCHDLTNVRFELRGVPQQFPDQNFDLILLSEVGYYLSMPDLLQTRQLILDHLETGAHLLLVHWVLDTDYPLTGDEVHETFLALPATQLKHLVGQREAEYRLDLFEKA